MNITSRLALNGLKRNRKRTAGALAAIALSSALITAVLCFAESAIGMFGNLLGELTEDYIRTYRMIVLLPAILLTGLIAFMAISVISNIFQASASDRVKELGILKCVGGTRKQIKATVMSEGIWLSIVGIPCGLILGTLLGFLSVKIAGLYIDKLAEITRGIVMQSFNPDLKFRVSVVVYLFASVFSFVTVLLSARKPAKQMSRITAVECVTFGNTGREVIKKASGNKAWGSLFGFEGELGARNIKRNRKLFKPAIRALSLGFCLLIVTAGISSQFDDIRDYMKSAHNLLMIDYVSLRDETVDPDTGRAVNKILHPIDSSTYNEITDRFNEFGDFEVYGIGSNREIFLAKADTSVFTDEMNEREEAVTEFGDMELDIVSLSDGLYRKICEASGTKYGGNILINTYTYNDKGEIREIVPFDEAVTGFDLVTYDGKDSGRVAVDGFLYREDMDEWLFDYANRATLLLIVPGAEARYFDWFCEPGEDEQEFISYAHDVMDQYFPEQGEDSYTDHGYSVRISREDTMVAGLNVMFFLLETLMYGFVILLTLMGFAGFISTITANIRARSREFAVLKSVGMTSGAIRKMLYSESLYCSIRATVIGGILGILISWLINLAVRNAFPVKFHMPVVMMILSVAVIFAVVLVITGIEIRKMKGQSIIETIRMDSIR